MYRAAILIAGFDPGYLRIAEHQVRRELAAGHSAVVIDPTKFLGGAADSYDRGTLQRFGIDYPGHDLGERMAALGVDVIRLEDVGTGDASQPLSEVLEERLAIAVQSALITYFRTDQPDRRKRLVGLSARTLTEGGRSVYRGMTALFSREKIDTVYLPNGRFPLQKMAHLAAADAAVPVLHFEKGETPNGTYLKPYAPQDRIGSQDDVDPTLAGLSAAEVDEIADTWLKRRAPSEDSSNEFSALWAKGLSPELAHLGGDAKVVGFFTSSQDEFVFLGPEWQLHDWDDQFQAFDLLLSEFERQGYAAYLRVHPNLATKAQDCFVRERDGIRMLAAKHPHLTVIWHDDFANTYALLEHTDVVVVWDSTVGLEASARGIPVITTATSRYGLVADIREILSVEDLSARGVEPWTVDPHRARKFIAYIVLRDEQMDPDYQTWLPWDRSNPPFGATVAGALVSGGVPYKSEAIGSILDVYRHRSLRSNLRHLRGR